MNQKVPKDSIKIAGRVFDTSDYQKDDPISVGLATTHEQVSDNYMGELDAGLDTNNEKERSLPRQGFTQG